MRRLMFFAFVLAASAACSKGSGGKDGIAGMPGIMGNWAIAPRITSIDPPVASYDSVILVQGADFAVVTTDNEVWIGGAKAEVLTASSTALTVTHLGTP